jgi:inner membrane protein involved in colicin E2 resistance
VPFADNTFRFARVTEWLIAILLLERVLREQEQRRREREERWLRRAELAQRILMPLLAIAALALTFAGFRVVVR